MIIAETWPPIGRFQDTLKRAGQIDEEIAHQEEHGEYWGNEIKIANDDAQLGNGERDNDGRHGLASLVRVAERVEKGHDLVLGNGL